MDRDDELLGEELEAPEPVSSRGDALARSDEGSGAWAKIAIVGVLLVGGVVGLILTTDAGEALAYTQPLAAVAQNPGDFAGRPLRVEGDLTQGSIRFREDPCEWRFRLNKEDEELAVHFPQCVVPDTFRDEFGISVTVQGTVEQVEGETVFVASEVVPRCPSKYEMNERLQAGEEMPHDMPAAAQRDEPPTADELFNELDGK
ncbi:MAG: cytochrome c maturation protein CcmE [Myxococcota bacterium]